jgi:hypothetical protein
MHNVGLYFIPVIKLVSTFVHTRLVLLEGFFLFEDLASICLSTFRKLSYHYGIGIRSKVDFCLVYSRFKSSVNIRQVYLSNVHWLLSFDLVIKLAFEFF